MNDQIGIGVGGRDRRDFQFFGGGKKLEALRERLRRPGDGGRCIERDVHEVDRLRRAEARAGVIMGDDVVTAFGEGFIPAGVVKMPVGVDQRFRAGVVQFINCRQNILAALGHA